jgi:hypothetical protein
MSHVAKIELEIKDLDTLKGACERLGLEFMRNQKTYAWYGTNVGDYPLPDGVSVEDLGKCDHAIRVPGATYEIGIVSRENKYILLWDFYRAGGLEQVLGKNAGKLKQAYAIERLYQEAKRKGYHIIEQTMNQTVRITISC